MSYVRVPFMPKAEYAVPLQRIVEHVAATTGVSHFRAAEMMTRVFEGIADQVSLGHVVRVPGFGIFGPWLWESKDGSTPVYPRFVAARPFRNQVRNICSPGSAKNYVLSNFQRSHHPSSRPDKAGSQTWTAMEVWRESLRADPAYDGPLT